MVTPLTPLKFYTTLFELAIVWRSDDVYSSRCELDFTGLVWALDLERMYYASRVIKRSNSLPNWSETNNRSTVELVTDDVAHFRRRYVTRW